MFDLNRVTLCGHLGADAELHYSSGGGAVLRLRLAMTERWKDKEHTEWASVVAFGKLAEAYAKLPKGAHVYVEGKLRTSNYEKDGVKRYTTDIVALSIMREAPIERATARAPDKPAKPAKPPPAAPARGQRRDTGVGPDDASPAWDSDGPPF